MAQQSYLIKILTGSNAGGEIEVFSTSVLVGDTDECDIILGDPFLEDRTFTMDIYEDYISIVRNGLPFYLDGKSLRDEEFTARFYTVITVGSTSFVVGETNVLWPDIALPEIFLEEGQETPEETEEEEEEQREHDDTVEEREDEEESSSLENLLDQEDTDSEDDTEEENIKKTIKSSAFLAMLLRFRALFIILLIAIISVTTWYFFIRKPSFASEEYMKDIHQLLRENGYMQLRVGVRKPDLLIITGFVQKKEDLDVLENLVYNKAPRVLLFIKDMAQVLQEIQTYLEKNSIFVKTKYLPQTSTFTVSGYMKDEKVLERVQTDLQDLLPIFKILRWKIKFWDAVKPVLLEEIRTADIEDALVPFPYDFTIQIRGELTDKEQKKWITAKTNVLGMLDLSDAVLIDKIERVRARDPEKKKNNEKTVENKSSVLGEGLMTILGIQRKHSETRLSDLPPDTNFDEVMKKDPCKYISIVPGEILFVKINGEQGLYSTGSMLPGSLKIRDILQQTIILEDKAGTFIFCSKN